MTATPLPVPNASRSSLFAWIGALLLAFGCACHVFAARAIGGTWIAYRDHMAGFLGATLLSWAVLALLGRRFWSSRSDVTLLVLGVLQAAFGVYVWINRFHLHG